MIQCECPSHMCITVCRPPALQAVGFFLSRVALEYSSVHLQKVRPGEPFHSVTK